MNEWITNLNRLIKNNNATRHSQHRLWKERCANNRSHAHGKSMDVIKSDVSDISDSDINDSEMRDTVLIDDDGNFDQKSMNQSNNNKHNARLINHTSQINNTNSNRGQFMQPISNNHNITTVLTRKQAVQSLIVISAILMLQCSVLLYGSTYSTINEFVQLFERATSLLMRMFHLTWLTSIQKIIQPVYTLIRVPVLISAPVIYIALENSKKIELATIVSIVEAILILDWLAPVK